MIVKSPAVSGVTATSLVVSLGMSVSILSGLDMKPWTRSLLVSRRITGSPFLRVISLGVNSNFFAEIWITFGLSLAWTRLVFGKVTARVIAHAAANVIAVAILLLNSAVFIFLFVLCIVAPMFQHLIHSDRARELGRRQLDFLELQIAAAGVAVDPPDSEVFERSRLVEGQRLFLRRRRRVGEGEDQRAGRVHFRAAGLVKILAMNVAVEHGHVLVRRQRVHNVVAVGGEPFPLGLQVEQRAMGEDDDRRGLREAREV